MKKNWLQQVSVRRFAGSGTITAYHATMSGPQILSDGFKTRQQLNERASLGGGSSDSVSFTSDWAVAKGIFDAFIFAHQLANAPDSVQFTSQHFYQSDATLQGKIRNMFKAIHGGGDGYLNVQMQGMTFDGVFGMGTSGEFKQPLTLQELQNNGFQPVDGNAGAVDDKYYQWLRPMTPKETDNFLYDYLKAYYAADNQVYNPVFFGTNINNFRGIDRNNIGIVSASLFLDPSRHSVDDFHENTKSYRYVSSMAEIRVYDLSIIQQILGFENQPGARPKFFNDSTHYFNENENAQTSINNLLNFLYKNYQSVSALFKQTGMAIDSVISILQSTSMSDNNQLYSVLYEIKKRIGMKGIENVLVDYAKMSDNMKIPKDVQELLQRLPQEYSSRIANGEKADDVLYELYENDKNAYDAWWSSFSTDDVSLEAYQAEKRLNDWVYDRETALKQWERYGKEYERILVERFGGQVNAKLLLQLNKLLDNVLLY